MHSAGRLLPPLTAMLQDAGPTELSSVAAPSIRPSLHISVKCAISNTVAILAQGTNWADAFTQAFLLRGPTSTVCAERSDPAIAGQNANVIETNLRLRVSVATLRGAPVHVQVVLASEISVRVTSCWGLPPQK